VEGSLRPADSTPRASPTPPADPAQLVGNLAHELADVRLDERYPGLRRAAATPGVHRITHPATRLVGLPLPPPEVARELLLGSLEVVHGVGPVTAARLRAEGVTSVGDLLDHPVLQIGARTVLAEWEHRDLGAISARLTRRLGERGHLRAALVCAMVGIEKVAFFDLETMGLSGNALFLAGVGRVRGRDLVVEQLLAPSIGDEVAVVAAALEALADAEVVVTFNGRTADLPWLVARAFYYDLGPVPPLVHVDLVYGTRRRFVRDEGRLADARLATVSEEVLGLPRPPGDLPSWLVPHLYEAYATAPTEREGFLVPILEHNRSDVHALAVLLERLCCDGAGAPAPSPAR